ncbi:MAG TPA: hypothetical protein VE992_06070 [Solirubrobacteraceae bacterium]|nr:hypothetical protein [Solirubrobacteraceae bacterium]
MEVRHRTWMRMLTGTVAAAALLLAPAAASAASPSVVGSVSDPVNLSGIRSVAVSGHYAYTPSYFNGELTAVDISNPTAPAIVGESAASAVVDNADFVTVSGGYAYVTSKNRNQICQPGPAPNCQSGSNDDGTGNGLSIFDIHTDPAHPALVGWVSDTSASTTALFGAYGVAVSGSYAYVSAQGCLTTVSSPTGEPCPDPTVGDAFDVIDISNPASPQLVATIRNPATGQFADALHHADSVVVSGSDAYVTASYSHSLTVIDISHPLVPQIVGMLHDSTNLPFPNDVAVQGTHAYVANQISPSGLLTVLDVSNPQSPQVVGSVSSSQLSAAYEVQVRGSLAYVAAFHANAISLVNISNPAAPAVVGAVTDGAHLNHTSSLDFALAGRYVIATSPFLSTETSTDYPPYPLAGGTPNTGTVSVLDMDPNPVGVSITSPAGGATYKQGQAVTAAYTCTPGGLFAVTSCQGPVASGGAIDTSTPGQHTFTVNGTDQDGQTGSATVSYTVQAPPPALTHVHQTHKRWREHGTAGRHKPPVGTAFSFTLNEKATVTLTITEKVQGRRSGKRCVAPTRKNRHHRACRRTLTFKLRSLTAQAGANRLAFRGKVGGKYLKPGTYTLVITATANGKTTRARLTFTIVR